MKIYLPGSRDDLAHAIYELQNELADLPEGTLYVKRRNQYFYFSLYCDSREQHLPKDSPILIALARKKLLVLKKAYYEAHYFGTSDGTAALKQYSDLLTTFAFAGLDLRKLLLSDSQYTWVNRKYPKKPLDSDLYTQAGVNIRSKSEQSIGNALEKYAAPYRYEGLIKIYVLDLLECLQAQLIKSGEFKGHLFKLIKGKPVWQVPPRLQWMNASGSIWKSYNHRDGCLYIYPDFTIRCRDGRLLYWEHEGMSEDFGYRSNASERAFVMMHTGFADQNSLIFSFEADIADPNRLDAIIQQRVLPYI